MKNGWIWESHNEHCTAENLNRCESENGKHILLCFFFTLSHVAHHIFGEKHCCKYADNECGFSSGVVFAIILQKVNKKKIAEIRQQSEKPMAFVIMTISPNQMYPIVIDKHQHFEMVFIIFGMV